MGLSAVMRELETQRSQWNKMQIEAVRSFNPGRYKGDIVLFKSIDDGLNSHYGWHELIDGTVTEFMISGAHGEILKDSNVEPLAGVLDSILRKKHSAL